METLKVWGKGALAAFISAFGQGIISYVVDPITFSDWTKLFHVSLVSGLLGLAFYMKQSPLGK